MGIRYPLVLFLAAFAALASLGGAARAQSCGGSAGPPPAGAGASEGSWPAKGHGFLRLSEEYEVKDRSFRGRDRVVNDFDESVFISRSAVEVRYGLTDDWAADLTATYPHFTYRVKPPGGERLDRRFRGPGDTYVSIGRRLMLADEPSALPGDEAPPHPVVLGLWAGVSLPTGTPEEPNPAFVTRDVSVANLQTGTGTYDPFVRIRADWPQRGWTPFAEAGARVPLSENRYGYRTGDAETIVVGAAIPIAPRLSAGLAAMYQRTARDTFRGDDVGVGGATWVYLVPSVSWQVTESVALDAGLRFPLYRRTETKLSDSSVVLAAGLTFSF